jgi:hypothetical protein
VQQQGSLQEASLASLLQTMQAERATGTLAVESGADNASLYFLFGHLFHAAGPRGQGEDVVIDALSWHEGNFTFDPRAKLPAEETIKASPTELIAEAERRGPATATATPPAPEAWGTTPGFGDAAAFGAADPAQPGFQSTGGFGMPDNATAFPGPFDNPAQPGFTAEQPEEPAADATAAWATPQTDAAPAEEATPAPAEDNPWAAPAAAEYNPWAAPGQDAAGGQEAAPAEAEPATPAFDAYSAPEPAPQAEPEPATWAAPATAPEPEPAAQPDQAVLGATGAGTLDILYPLPSGKAQYEGLKAAFVDFPKLLRTLRNDQHTGYVRLEGAPAPFEGVLLFHQGHLLQALSNDAGAQIGEEAFLAVRRHMDTGEGLLDVIELQGDTVEALAQLLSAPLLYTGLVGHFVNFSALLEHLAESKVDGAVVVVGGEDVGIVLLRGGDVTGAYTESAAQLKTATTDVAKIASEKGARIEVKSGTGAVSAIDIEQALTKPY